MRWLRDLVLTTAVNALALWVASLLLPGLRLGAGDGGQTLWTVVLVALVFGAINAVVKPVVAFVAAPIVWLTIGVFRLVINALMIQLTSWVAERLGLAFSVEHFFWDAVLAGLVVTFVSILANGLLPDRRDRDRAR